VLVELAVKDLGIIEATSLSFGPGLTALTGETGAGKTLVVDALSLLGGARSDVALVRTGADAATVEARFVVDSDFDLGVETDEVVDLTDGGREIVLRRVVPATGRSRAYLNGSMITVAELQTVANRLLALHAQHGHHELLEPSAQTGALDSFGAIDTSALRSAEREVRRIRDLLGADADPRARLHEIDLLQFQLEELDGAAITSASEDDDLKELESLLGSSLGRREAADAARALIGDEGGAADLLGNVRKQLGDLPGFDAARSVLAEAEANVVELAAELRSALDAIDDDPERLSTIQERRAVLSTLRRKYGETLAEVIEHHKNVGARLAELVNLDASLATARADLEAAEAHLCEQQAQVRAQRVAASVPFAGAVMKELATLALGSATFAVHVEEHNDGRPTFMFSANRGEELRPLVKVASGGELARSMLALRLVVRAAADRTSPGPSLMVFDEVDAGIGGDVGRAVGLALKAIADQRQVLVVTHLAQVASAANNHVFISKEVRGERTVSVARTLDNEQRVSELARMLSGEADRPSARQHALDLLADSAHPPKRAGGRGAKAASSGTTRRRQ
jgi:DNA repair protein RecN (Recombination protein N)